MVVSNEREQQNRMMNTMNLQRYYDHLYEESIGRIENNTYEIDRLIDSPDDKRFGLTLLIRPSAEITREISAFLKEMKIISPHQYCYPQTDMHITVLSIISCFPDFSLSSINTQAYIDTIQRSAAAIERFSITFTGVTASSSCIMIQGFPSTTSLTRLKLR